MMRARIHDTLTALACLLALALWPAAGFAQDAAASVSLDDELAGAAADGGDTDADANADASANAPATELDIEAMRARAANSLFGATGGLHLVDAASGLPGSVRMQLSIGYFRGSEYLVQGDTNETVNGELALSVTVSDHLELFGTFQNRANSNNTGTPVLLQVVGDTMFGLKGYAQVLPWLGLGGDMRIALLNTVGDLGFALDATSLGLRGELTADLRRLQQPLPVIVRGNLDYFVDNSGQLITDLEEARFRALNPSTRLDRASEDRHLITRTERLGFGVNRVDMLTFGLGAELPLRAAEDFYVQPLTELRLGVPVNRQGYNCLAVATDASVGRDDGCLGVQGLAAAPSSWTLGVRVLPPLRGFVATLGLDVGLGGTGTFVRELAPNHPWMLLVALAYGSDARPDHTPASMQAVLPPPAPVVVEKERARVEGVIVEQGSGNPIAGAAIRYMDLQLSAQLSGDDGRFTSYELDAGEVKLSVSHPDYEPAICSLVVPEVHPEPAAGAAPTPAALPPAAAGSDSGLVPVDESSPDGAIVAGAAPSPETSTTSTTPAAEDSLHVPMRCELVARPRAGAISGKLLSDTGVAVPNASIELRGPTTRTLTSDAQGAFSAQDLAAGAYSLSVDLPDYLSKREELTVQAGIEASVVLSLAAKPKDSQVTITAREVKIRKQIMFKPNSADIDEQSTALMTEIADVLMRNPNTKQLQVQGHTDNRGDSDKNLTLSQDRAESVLRWLVNAGVGAERLEAKGYGDTRPLLPNLTPGNRARNRRVQFIFKD